MGVAASQPNDADLSWEAGLYRYEVRSARARTHVGSHIARPAGHDAYPISVSEIEHKRTETASFSSISDTCESVEGDRIEIAWENQVGLVMSFRDGKWSVSQPLLRSSDFTVWKTISQEFEWIVKCRRPRKMDHYASDYDTEGEGSDYDTESEDPDDTRPKEYECVALYSPTNRRPNHSLGTIDWHKAMGEIVKAEGPNNPHSIICYIRPAIPDEEAIDDDTWALSSILEDISISFSTLSISTLSCGIVIGMVLSKYYVEKAS